VRPTVPNGVHREVTTSHPAQGVINELWKLGKYGRQLLAYAGANSRIGGKTNVRRKKLKTRTYWPGIHELPVSFCPFSPQRVTVYEENDGRLFPDKARSRAHVKVARSSGTPTGLWTGETLQDVATGRTNPGVERGRASSYYLLEGGEGMGLEKKKGEFTLERRVEVRNIG